MFRSESSIAASVILSAGLLLGSVASAQTTSTRATPVDNTRFEITPTVGLLAGGEFEDPTDGSDRDVDNGADFKLFFNANAGGRDRQYEVFYARQATTVEGTVPLDMDIQYLHFGGIVNFIDVGSVVPFFGITVGATHFSPDASGLDDETKFSASVGTGLKYKFTKNIGLRLDVRALVTLIDSDGSLFCVSGPAGAGCAIAASGDTFVQYGAGLGLIAAF